MAKIITRSEVNAIVEGTFSTDLTKAVLYGEVSGNPNFIVSAVNSVSQLNYTASQALLEVDIRRATSLVVTLTPRTTDILSTDTTIVFDITTGGTGTITSLEPVVVTRGGVDISTNFSIAADGKTATLTFPQNTTYSPMEIDVQIKAVTMDGDFPSNTSVLYQNPASRLEFANSTSNQDSTATTTTQAFYNNNCTGVGVYSATTDTNATISGDHVIITFPENSGSSPVTRIVCISGVTADNVTVYAYHTITQAAASPTGVDFRYSGYRPLSPAAGSISSSDFILTLTNAELTGCRGINGITPTTGGTADNPTISATYDANTMPPSKNLTIAITATTIYGETITDSVVIPQEGDTYTLSLSPNTNPVVYNATTNTLTITSTNISNIGWDSVHSSGINNCSISPGIANVTFNQNTGASPLTKTVAITGMTRAGRTVSTTTEFEQQGSVVFSIQYTGSPVESSAGTTNKFAITAQNANVTGFSVDNGAQVQTSSETSVTISYLANQDDDEWVTYTVTMLGSGSSGPLSTTCTFRQMPDGYTFELTPNENPVAFNSTSTTFAIASQFVSNIGWVSGDSVNVTSCTISNGNAIVSYSANSTTSTRPITVVVSGRTVGGKTVTASGTTTQEGKAVRGSIDVKTGTRQWHLGPSSGTNSFDVVWHDLKPGSTIALSGGSRMSNISPASISVDNTGAGSAVVSFNYTAYSGSGSDRLYLTANGIDNNDETVTDNDYFEQYTPIITVSTVSTSPVSYDTTSVTFNISWVNVWDTIDITSNIGTPSSASTVVTETGNRNVDVTISTNTSTNPRDIILTANAPVFGVSGSATIVQDGMALEGSISVTPDSGVLAYDATQMIFTVSWTNLQSGTTISLTKSSAISSISPASISITSANAGSGSQNVSGTTTVNTGSARTHTLTATGTDGRGITRTDTGSFIQDMPTGSLSWSTSSILIPAFVPNTYDGRVVSSAATFSFSYLSSVSAQTNSANIAITGFSTAGTPTVHFICQPNEELQQITVGTILLIGTDNAGNTLTRTLTVYQEAGVVPSIKISRTGTDWSTNYNDVLPEYRVEDEEYFVQWNYAQTSLPGYSFVNQGNIEWVQVRPGAEEPDAGLLVTLCATTQQVTSSLDITGTSVYGHAVSGRCNITQYPYVPPTPTTYSLVFYWETSDGTRKAGELQYRVNGGDWQTAGMYSQATVSGLHLNDTITYVMSSASGLNYLKYSSTVTVDGTLTDVVGRAVPDAFVVNIGPYDTPDYQTNIFSVSYQTHNGSSGTAYITCSGGNSGTTTISLGTGYTTDDSDYMAYTVRKIGGNILLEGWDLSGTNGSGSNLTQNALDNRLSSMDITDGEPANITLKYRGSYTTATINWNAEDASNTWRQIDIVIGDYITISTTLEEDHGTFYYDSPSDSKQCYISGGIGDNQVYKQFYMRIMASDGITQLFHGNCELLYGPLAGINLTTSQLNGSTWYLSNARP